jgi:hypothetical protein
MQAKIFQWHKNSRLDYTKIVKGLKFQGGLPFAGIRNLEHC